MASGARWGAGVHRDGGRWLEASPELPSPAALKQHLPKHPPPLPRGPEPRAVCQLTGRGSLAAVPQPQAPTYFSPGSAQSQWPGLPAVLPCPPQPSPTPSDSRALPRVACALSPGTPSSQLWASGPYQAAAGPAAWPTSFWNLPDHSHLLSLPAHQHQGPALLPLSADSPEFGSCRRRWG